MKLYSERVIFYTLMNFFGPIPMYETNAIQLHFLWWFFWYLSQWSGLICSIFCNRLYSKDIHCAGMGLNGFILFLYFLKYESIETHARTFLMLNILAIGRVYNDRLWLVRFFYASDVNTNSAFFFSTIEVTLFVTPAFEHLMDLQSCNSCVVLAFWEY